ncbi:MAG: ROK family protein, partial [Lactococcus raffinolactis]
VRQGDAQASKVMDRYYEDVAKGLLNLVCAFDPEVILLGGGISANDEFLCHLSERVDKIKQHHKSLNHLTGVTVADIKPCLLRNDAGLIGAVYQAKQIVV